MASILSALGVRKHNNQAPDPPTARSNFSSHMSLIVHPAPRMTTAPTANNAVSETGTEGGRLCIVDANMIPHAAHEPDKTS